MQYTTFNKGWHVLYVKPNWEKKVHEALKQVSLESFLPLIKVVSQWSDRKKTIHKPLFPSYVFINLNSALEFQKALTVNGAYTYIKFSTEHARVTENEIDQIKFLVGSNNVTDLKVNSHLPKKGDIKKIVYGSFSGLECEVIEVENVNKVIVQLELFNNNITATIPSFYFEGLYSSQKA